MSLQTCVPIKYFTSRKSLIVFFLTRVNWFSLIALFDVCVEGINKFLYQTSNQMVGLLFCYLFRSVVNVLKTTYISRFLICSKVHYLSV